MSSTIKAASNAPIVTTQITMSVLESDLSVGADDVSWSDTLGLAELSLVETASDVSAESLSLGIDLVSIAEQAAH